MSKKIENNAKSVLNSSSNSALNSNKDGAKSPPKLAIVSPCYNEEEIIQRSFKILAKKLNSLIAQGKISKDSFLCFVDDGSKDKTCEILLWLKNGSNLLENGVNLGANSALNSSPNSSNDEVNSTPQTHIVKLSKNYGQQNALLAGLSFVKDKCDCAISIDCDLQDDIRVIDTMIEHFKGGTHIVYGAKKRRDTDTFFKKYTALAFYKFMAFMGVNLVYNHTDFRLLSARVLGSLLEFKEVNLFLRGIVPLLGFKSEVVYYDILERVAGKTKYSYFKLFALAWEAITSFSVAPLRIMSLCGLLCFLGSLFYGAYALYMKFFTATPVSGWTSIVLILLFFGGMQFMGLGIMGEYIGKIYAEVKHRPRFFVEEVL